MGVTGAAAPAFAEQVTPSTPAPTESATPTPSPEATEPPATPTETPAPTETPTPDPTPTPEPTPTPTPTPEPTPTPTPTPTPEPTPTPTPPPTGEPQPTPPPETTPSPTPVDPAAGSATAAPGLLSPGTQALFSRSSPTLLAANTSSARAFEVAQARLRVETATADLRRAQTALAGARQDREVAQAIANHLQILADNALHDAEAAMRTYFAAAKGDGTTYSSMSAVFGAGNDLLAGLGGVARIAQIHGEAKQLLEMAQKRSDTAETAQQRADAAWAAVDAVPVESLEREVANAETALGVAQMALSNAETESFDSRLASSDVSLLLESLPTDSGQLSAQGWSLPVAGRITDTFGPRPNKPLPGVNEFHRGTDIAATCGSPVFAATGGTVASAGPNGSLGNWILLEHGEGVETGYGHLSPGGILVSPGQPVTAGQLIGMVGTTGASTGCHLHFEVHLDGTAIDAVPFMAARGVTLG